MTDQPILRVARPTNDLADAVRFYRDALGLTEIGRFEDHNGFDGVMLGQPGGAYHFEFTHAHGHDAGRAPTQDNLVVFYYPQIADRDAVVARFVALGFAPTPSFNPYWDRHGVTFEDADGYRVVLQNDDGRRYEA